MNPISINVTIIDENITLTCVAMGVPRPFITWTHNGTLLNEDGALGDFENGIDIDSVEDILGTIESTLTIDSALANHTGEYFCTATSPVEDYDSVMSTIALVLVQGEYLHESLAFTICVLTTILYFSYQNTSLFIFRTFAY